MVKKEKKLKHGCLVKWRTRLEKARKRGYFTKYEDQLAENWKACAVGEAHELNPNVVEYDYEAPIDSKLSFLGLDFADLVSWCTQNHTPIKRDFNKVETCLNKIEKHLEKLYTLSE